MKKVVINLNPQKEKNSSLALQNMVSYTPLVVIAAILGLGLVLLVNVAILKKAHSYTAYNKRWKQWSEKAKILQDVKSQMDKLKKEKGQLDKILTPSYEMALILGDIFSSLPKNIWFQNFDFHDQVLKIEGYVVKWNQDYLVSIEEFIKGLRQKEYFSSKFGSSEIVESIRVDFNGQEVLKFIIECKR
ncbi:MAG: PilN domain-containing protein [Candidatus Omnitrophica bacterium]|nr:PilN domain-containing protein [Candidatus Omnitrophota bacterium]MBU2043826.1 PilN domain-containing protein [Candidatus Omnitrophota bacterium]MBU2251141.1 PilN domain-containing protein [Candidatus Omnitrophota bacterium]MBU2473164.1 PilN domain-containing protein [Candidatus Omnitrophota bacterium]